MATSPKWSFRYKRLLLAQTILISVILLACVIGLAIWNGYLSKVASENQNPKTPEAPPWPKPSRSPMPRYTRAAVASDHGHCAEIGRNMMLRNGSSVDALIATNICQGALHPQASGIGGGFFMTIYDKASKSCVAIDAREEAHARASELTSENTAQGWTAPGVPGEIYGMWVAHQRFGRLPWKTLFEPAIHFLETGFLVSGELARVAKEEEDFLKDSAVSRNLEIFLNQQTRKPYKRGEVMTRPVLAKTLNDLADAPDPVQLFYKGRIADTLVQEIQSNGGFLTKEDFTNYEPRVQESPISMEIPGTELVVCGPRPPSSGVIVASILNTLSGLNISPRNLSTTETIGELLNNYVETLKFSYGARTRLGDPKYYEEALPVIANITKPSWGEYIRSRIPVLSQPVEYYGGRYQLVDSGTSHISVIDSRGNAAGITSSVNTFFGAKVRSKELGIILNNQLNDFSFRGAVDAFGYAPFEGNYAEPGKKPLSSMSPMVIYNKQSGEPFLVIGASGGSRIISSIANVALRTIWLKQSIKEAIDAPRVHNQLSPNVAMYDYLMPEVYPQYLQMKHGQSVARFPPDVEMVAIGLHKQDGVITGNCDYRKPGGYPAGF